MQLKDDVIFNSLTNKAEGFALSLDIGNNTFPASKINSLEIRGASMDKLSVGNCPSRQITLTVAVDSEIIPKMAKIEPYLSIGSSVVKKGTFFVDVRKKDPSINVVSFTGYDSMLKAEVDFLPSGSTWESKSIADCIATICEDIGVNLDQRVLSMSSYSGIKDLLVGFPNGGDGFSYSDREMLGYFGVAMGGNWIITDENTLLLVPLKQSNADNVNVGIDASKLTTSEPLAPITKLIINTSEESSIFVWRFGQMVRTSSEMPDGWDTMNGVLEVSYPLVMAGENDMLKIARNIFMSVENYTHKPFNALDVELDLRAEIGDSITIDGNTYPICAITTNYDGGALSAVSCPDEGETESEYPYKGGTARKFDRKIRDLQTRFSVEVGKVESAIEGKISTFRQATVPEKANAGDLWYCTQDNGEYAAGVWYRYDGENWEETNADIAVAPDWESGKEYKANDVVDYNGAWYKAKIEHVSSQNNMPPHDSYWERLNTLSAVAKTQITQTVNTITLEAVEGVNQSTVTIKADGIEVDSKVVKFKTIDADSIKANSEVISPLIYNEAKTYSLEMGKEHSGFSPDAMLLIRHDKDAADNDRPVEIFSVYDGQFGDVAMSAKGETVFSFDQSQTYANGANLNSTVTTLETGLKLVRGVNYGTRSERAALANPQEGQLWLLID